MASEWREPEGQFSCVAPGGRADVLPARGDVLPARFLLNSLHAVSVLVRKDERDRAVRTLSRLGGLLRHVIAGSERVAVPLREELAFLEEYVALESVRVGGSLRLDSHVDVDARDHAVPSLLLLPLVVDAVRRTVGSGEGPRTIRVEALAENGGLTIEVTDDGDGFPDEILGAPAERDGLGGVWRWLERTEGAALELENGSEGGGVIRVRLPPSVVVADAEGEPAGGQTPAQAGEEER